MSFISEQLIFILRLLLALTCGIGIGYERKNRGKGAGVRTHAIVALAAALMMIISKYGFSDLVDGYGGTREADPARIAAQVVSGVGFLGAGTIYFNRHLVRGLTTAAGIWATAGVGLAMGAGLYVIAITSTIMIILLQVILHKKYKFLNMPNEEVLTITIANDKESLESLHNILKRYNINVCGMKCRKKESGYIEIDMDVSINTDIDYDSILKTFNDISCIQSFSI